MKPSIIQQNRLEAKRRWGAVAAGLLEVLFVPRCIACDVRLPPHEYRGALPMWARHFCDLCAGAVQEWEPPFCTRCGDVFSGAGPSHRCADCARHPPSYGQLRAVAEYGGEMATAIARFKYGPAPWMARPLGEMLAAVPLASPVDWIVPVPLHPKRLRARGFNQSALLARRLSRLSGAPICWNALQRTSHSAAPQAARTRNERLQAMRGAFVGNARAQTRGGRVLLLDDVVTTGATVEAAARALLRQGEVRAVDVLCLARTGRD
ncbi:MAG: ComF family protein [Myxococcales bacterium]|jgi:ComF family protein|nr:ComF family protein [Myxococcales bacterium]